MAKSVPITPRIQNLITRNTGGDQVDFNAIVVFEASVTNTRPLTKPGSIFDKGQIQVDTLNQMASYLNSGGFVPLQTLHPNGDELPLGRFFYGEVLPSTLGDGSSELVCLFYLPKDDSNVPKLENGIIDEVSVGFVGQQLLCSKCSWDWRGPEASFSNFYDRVCGNDHVLGEDGAYLKINGLDRWTETSLVSKGAANNAKILGRTKQRLGQEQYDRLAASGVAPEHLMLIATTTTSPRSPKTMDKELIEELANLKAGQKIHEHTISLKDAEITALKTTNEALSTENKTLKEGTELKAAQTSLAESQAKVTELEASAKTAETEVADLKAKLATAEAQVEVLKAGAGNGGRSQGSDTGTGATQGTTRHASSAFKSAPR